MKTKHIQDNPAGGLRLTRMLIYPLYCVLSVYACSQEMPSGGEEGTGVDDEVIKLSEFSVTAKSVQGYMASESETGSRVATKIIELPYNVNVVTRDLMLDFAADELEEQMGYTSSFAPSEEPGNYTIRGIPVAKQLRNGFNRLGMAEKINTARIEVIKGPAAAVYGATQPGGIINVITEKPRNKPYYRMDLSMGSYDYSRAEITATGPLPSDGKPAKTFYLLNGTYNEKNYEQTFRHTEIKMAYLVLLHKFSENTSLTIDVEYLRRDSQRGNHIPYQFMPVSNGAGSYSHYTGLGMELFDYSWNGPDSFTNRELSTLGVTFEHRFNSVFSMRAAGNYFKRNYWRLLCTGDGYNPETRRTEARAPSYYYSPQETTGAQVDFLAHYRLGGVEMKTLLTFDYTDINIPNTFERRLPSAAADRNEIFPDAIYRLMDVDHPDYYLPAYNPDIYSRLYQDNKKCTDVYGVFLRQQMAFWKGRLIMLGGFRYDHVKFDFNYHVNYGSTLDVVERYSRNSPTWQGGLNFKLTENTVFYANRSESFDPQTVLGKNGERLNNEEGIGYETGFKIGLFDNKLRFTAGGFRIIRKNVRVYETEDVDDGAGGYTREEVQRTLGKVRSRGVELDFNYQPLPSLQFMGGVGYVDAETKYAGRDLDAVGRPPSKSPHFTGGLAAKYAFTSGPARGFSITAGVRHVGASFLVDPTTGGKDINQNGYIEAGENNGERDIKTPAYTLIDLGFRYNWKPRRNKIWQQIQVNIKNILDEQYVTNSAYPGEGCSVSVQYSIRY